MIFLTKYVVKFTNPPQKFMDSGKIYWGPYNTVATLDDALFYPEEAHAISYASAYENMEVKKIKITMEEIE